MWEYKMLKINPRGFWSSSLDWDAFSQQLNELGAQGWELVTLQDVSKYEGKTSYMIAVLKRPAPGASPA